jgi:hypothetical protein
MAYGMVIQSRVKKAVSTCDNQVVSCPDIELGGDKAVSKVLIQEGLTSNDVTPPFDPNHEVNSDDSIARKQHLRLCLP